MKVLIAFAAVLAIVASQQPYRDEIPIPYSFRYLAEGDDGMSTHEETSDANGRKVGSYSFRDAEGHTRTVEYTADEDGFNAVVKTNEPGTANQNPANVIMESSAGGAFNYGGGAPVSSRSSAIPAQPRPRSRPVAPSAPSVSLGGGGGRRGGGVAYVLVPVNEADGYY